MGGGEFPPENNHAATGDVGNLDSPRRREPSRWDELPPSFTMLPGGGGGAIILSGMHSIFNLRAFGHLRGFEFVKDRETGNSKGYAFCSYQDPSVTDVVCMALNGIKMGDRTLSVRRAEQASTQPTPQQDNVILHVAFQNLKLSGTSPTARPTKVVCLLHTVTVDDEKYENLMDDIRQEAERSGGLVNIVIPQPGLVGEVVAGVGKVFLEFADPESGLRAKEALAGSGMQVLAFFFPEDKFAQEDYSV